MKVITGTFRDKRGSEPIEIQTDGTCLTVVIRGVTFEGSDFDSLGTSEETGQFDLCRGDLYACDFSVSIPVRLETPDGIREVGMSAFVSIGELNAYGWPAPGDLRLHLEQPEFSIPSRGTSGAFEDEMLSIVSKLPQGFQLHACITCGLSDYSPAGSMSFGNMACFRDVPDEYRKVKSKSDIFALWDQLTDYVQETHYCPKFEKRPKGTGYRG
ncbi:MAG: DUF6304 family protein [Verrucomicrobiota bacterium]